MKLNKKELEIEKALIKGEYVDAGKSEFEAIAQAIARRRKEAVLHIRMNREDLQSLKKKARQYKVPYQTLISEILHRFAA